MVVHLVTAAPKKMNSDRVQVVLVVMDTEFEAGEGSIGRFFFF